jgi:hypothetical protein
VCAGNDDVLLLLIEGNGCHVAHHVRAGCIVADAGRDDKSYSLTAGPHYLGVILFSCTASGWRFQGGMYG